MLIMFQTVQYQEQGDLALQLLVKSQLMKEPLNLLELMKFPLSPVPLSLGTPDGFLAKTDKAKLVHYILKEHSDDMPPPTQDTFYIADGNALFHMMTKLPRTFEEICIRILKEVTPKRNGIIFSTDAYHPLSIKTQERLRRGTSDTLLLNGTKMRVPQDWHAFL